MAKSVPPASGDTGATPASESAVSTRSPVAVTPAASPLRSVGQSSATRKSANHYASVLLPSAGVFLFGVVLPLFTLCFELATRLCAASWFDPLPTWWHTVLVALVPISNLLVFATRFSKERRLRPWLAHLNAVAIGVCIAYFLAFIAYVPISLIGLFYLGMGLMPLAPILALPATISARRCIPHWGRVLGEEPAFIPRATPWVLGAIFVLALPAASGLFTRYELGRAASSDPAIRDRAVTILRWFGSEQEMIEACYPLNRLNVDQMAGWTLANAIEKNRETFYRVTGKAFNSVPAPRAFGARNFQELRGWNVDRSLGGERVANKVAGLTFETSRIDTKIDATGLTAYTEWTMVFKNVTVDPAEARAQIELPPGGVVSRLSLWIDGQPREAAFGGRSQVRAAYQEVAVVQRRDPVLVTTCGPDRVLMQCFPVPANGGEMKIRVGITAPLRMLDATSASLPWPRLLETNFESGGGLRHHVWVEATAPLAGGSQSLRGEWTDSRFDREQPVIIPLPAGAREVTSDDPLSPDHVILQSVRSVPVERLERLAIVIDGSREMAQHIPALRRALATVNATHVRVFFAGDDVETWDGTQPLDRWLRKRTPRGGRDNLPAIEAAWDYASAGQSPSAVLWIAGPQPVLLGSTEALRQRLDRTRQRPALYLASAGRGPNRLLEELDGLAHWTRLADRADLERNVAAFVAQALSGGERFIVERTRVPRAETHLTPAVDKHVARLWGREEVERLRATPAKLDEAVKLAVQLQLVTPVSGAVVLERQEQYDRHGLTPAESDTVPVIPEPNAALLLAAAAGWLGSRRRRSSPAPAARS